MVEALRRCQPTVQRHHPQRPKTRVEARFQLGGQVDLGHHHQRLGLRVGIQRVLHRTQVDLGLAAAGGPEQQHRPLCVLQRSQGGGLFGGQLGRRLRCGGLIPLDGGFTLQLLELALQLRRIQFAQLWGQSGQCHLAQRPLVVTCRERHQLAPAVVQRRQLLQRSQYRFGGPTGRCRVGRTVG